MGNGTDNHLILWNVRKPWGVSGFMVERVLESMSVTVNKNSILGDTSAVNPGGVRLGTPALTTRGFKTDDFKKVAQYLHDGCMLAVDIKNIVFQKEEKVTMKEFTNVLENNKDIQIKIQKLRKEVEDFAKTFDLP